MSLSNAVSTTTSAQNGAPSLANDGIVTATGSAGSLSLLGPVISVTLGDNFKAGAIPVLVTAESTVLENKSALPSLKNYSVGVYQSNTLICVYRANIDVSSMSVSQVNIKLKNPN